MTEEKREDPFRVVEIMLQVNGVIKDYIELPYFASDKEIDAAIKATGVAPGKIAKIIVMPGRLINVITKKRGY
jgi:hypothetical protein